MGGDALLGDTAKMGRAICDLLTTSYESIIASKYKFKPELGGEVRARLQLSSQQIPQALTLLTSDKSAVCTQQGGSGNGAGACRTMQQQQQQVKVFATCRPEFKPKVATGEN